MPLAGETTAVGPRVLLVACPAIVNVLKHKEERTVTVNTGPRAGQSWEVTSAAFRFPNASNTNFNAILDFPLEVTFKISMTIGGVVVATQEFLESSRAREPEEALPMHITGSLESLVPAVVYSGESISFTYTVESNGSTNEVNSGQEGLIVVTYNLITRDSRG